MRKISKNPQKKTLNSAPTNIISNKQGRNNKAQKKITSYPTDKKFTDPKLKKQMESFKQWEKRRKRAFIKIRKRTKGKKR